MLFPSLRVQTDYPLSIEQSAAQWLVPLHPSELLHAARKQVKHFIPILPDRGGHINTLSHSDLCGKRIW